MNLVASYGPMFLMILVAFALAGLFWAGATFLGPKNPTPEKMMPFECGSDSTGSRFVRPSVKFYLTAILFVVFDVEVVLMYPWVVSFRALGWTNFFTMASFVVLLVAA